MSLRIIRLEGTVQFQADKTRKKNIEILYRIYRINLYKIKCRKFRD